MANPVFKLNGQLVNPVKDWQNLEVLGTWSEDGAQANISVEELTFVNENAQTIRQYIEDGMTGGLGIFEGMPFNIELSNGQTLEIFDGILDLNEFIEETPVEVKCKLKKLDGLDQLSDRTSGLTMRFLYDEGVITQNDFIPIPYIREKPLKDSAAELALLSLSIFLLAKELSDLTEELLKELGVNAPAHTTGGITGPAAGAFYVAATLVLNIIYAGLLVVQLINLITELIQILVPPVRKWKGSKVKTLLEKGLGHIGYNYISSISQLDNLYILPSKNTEGKIFDLNDPDTVGFPDAIDYGYTLNELLKLVSDMFSARIKIVGNDVFQEPLINDSFWVNQANYQFPDVEYEKKIYNTNDLVGRQIIRYNTDLNDLWTILRYKGTGYEIVTQPNVVGNQKSVLIKGFKETIIPYALGDRKQGLNPVEAALKLVAQALDSVVNFFGGNSDQAGKIKSRTEMLHVSGESLSIGKLLYLTYDPGTNRYLMGNDRDKIEAQTLWTDYISESSFVDNNFRGQKRLFNELKIPFGFSDFIKVINNSYCTDQDGNVVKIEELKWSFDQDYAIVSGWRRLPYTTNLKQQTYFGLENQA